MGAVRSYEVYDKIARDLTYWMRVELGMTRDVLSVRTVRRHLQKRPGGRVPEYLLETGLQRIDARRPEES